MLDIMFNRAPAPLNASARQRVARLDRELRLNERARNAGIDNLPSAKDRIPDQAQHEILDRAAQAIADQRQHVFAKLRTSADDLARFNLDASKYEFNEDEQATYHAIRKMSTDAHATIRPLIVEEQRRGRELAAFRQANRLGRDASYPESTIFAALIATVLLLGEAFANASLFAATSDFGELGGALEALSFALPNFGLALFIGLIGLRYAGHVHLLKKYFGLVVSFGLGSLVVAYNLWLAHYRELLTTAPASARSSAMSHLMANPLQINDSASLVLLLIGLLAALVAVADGFHGFADKYPGYKAVDLRHRAARQACLEARAKFHNEIMKAVTAGTAGINRKEASVRRVTGAALRRIAAAMGVLLTFEQQVSNIQRAALLALRLYREANVSVRSTPAPAYFEVYPLFDPRMHALSIDPSIDPRNLRNALETGIAAILANAAAAKSRLRQANEQAVRRFDAHIERIAADLSEGSQFRHASPGILGASQQGADL